MRRSSSFDPLPVMRAVQRKDHILRALALFVKRGYETSVLAHTFSDGIPMMIFMR